MKPSIAIIIPCYNEEEILSYDEVVVEQVQNANVTFDVDKKDGEDELNA